MNNTLTYVVPKRTGTYADTLEAIGVASLLDELHYATVVIRDSGGEFSIIAESGPNPDAWPPVTPGFPYVWKDDPKDGSSATPPSLPQVLDYLAAKEQNERWKKFNDSQKKLRSAKMALEAGIELPERPPQIYYTASMLESMRKGWNGDRELALWLAEDPSRALSWVQAELNGDPAAITTPEISNSQIFNPIGGKGVHKPKTSHSAPNSLPDTLIRPFAEWMKFRGLWAGMLLHRSGDDFKFFVIEPADISLKELGVVHRRLQQANIWGVVKLDIWATFECLRTLLMQSEAMQPTGVSIFGRRPRAVIAGLRLAYFKSLGTAAAMMNDALFPLPDWFQVNSQDDASAYLQIISDTIGDPAAEKTWGCLNTLDESHSNEGRILQQYRTWLLTGHLSELLEFHAQYAIFTMQQRGAKKKFISEFQTRTLDLLFGRAFPQEIALQQIIHNEGFLSVARAVRDATINAEFKGRPVSFGLAQNWKQKCKAGNADFLAAVAEFIQEQNWLTQHRFKGAGHMVQTTQLDELVTLVDTFGAELIGSLLLAYGYSRTPKTTKEVETEVPAQ
jgi:hypothetical protein